MANNSRFSNLMEGNRFSRGLVWGILILSALVAFEIFNYSTTEFAMSDLLGDLKFLGMRWATILAIAFCGIDFAGIARLFTPEKGADEPTEVWYLFGAWLLAATMNAVLTWWGVSIAIMNHNSLGNAVIPRERLLEIVPVFVAVIVWLIRVLIIGTFSVAGERIFTQDDSPTARKGLQVSFSTGSSRSMPSRQKPRTAPSYSRPRPSTNRPSPQPSFRPSQTHSRQEPTYHPISMSAKPKNSRGDYGKGGADYGQDYSA